MNTRGWRVAAVVGLLAAGIVMFQNCGTGFEALKITPMNSASGGFQSSPADEPASIPLETVPSFCAGTSCKLNPLTTDNMVTVVLLELMNDSKNVAFAGTSTKYLIESIVRYTSKLEKPNILIVADRSTVSPTGSDAAYIAQSLNRYIGMGARVVTMTVPADGLKPTDVVGFDLVWYNNDDFPMRHPTTLQTLLAFEGGVVLQGDDMSWGQDAFFTTFDLSPLTGVTYVDNGITSVCNGVIYQQEERLYGAGLSPYLVVADPALLPFGSAFQTRYGNDIDNTKALKPNVQVMMSATTAPCTESRPVIFRHKKDFSPF